MIKVAVAYKDGEIYEHFGHSDFFAIYEFSGHEQMADLMKREGVDAVICGSMGREAHTLLLSYGIIPVAGYCGDADTAAELLVTGELPTSDGGACGGCGGCSGCAGGEDGGCGCGCGC